MIAMEIIQKVSAAFLEWMEKTTTFRRMEYVNGSQPGEIIVGGEKMEIRYNLYL